MEQARWGQDVMLELYNNDTLWAFTMRALEEFWMMDCQQLNDETLYCLLDMGIFDWRGPDWLLNQAQQAIHWSVATSTRCVKVEFPFDRDSSFLARLLNRILTKEECQTRLEAHTNVHIQSYVKKMRGVNCDLKELNRCGNRHHSELDSFKRK